MLKKAMVRSNASDPIASLAQTIEKNIRDKVYNHPILEFVPTLEGRLIGIPTQERMHGNPRLPKVDRRAVRDAIPADAREFMELSARLVNKADLLVMIGLAPTKESALDMVLTRGFDAMKDEIAAGLRDHLAK